MVTSPTAELPQDSFADLLAAFPATRSEILIGYARVSGCFLQSHSRGAPVQPADASRSPPG
jgi:hypothetical protein